MTNLSELLECSSWDAADRRLVSSECWGVENRIFRQIFKMIGMSHHSAFPEWGSADHPRGKPLPHGGAAFPQGRWQGSPAGKAASPEGNPSSPVGKCLSPRGNRPCTLGEIHFPRPSTASERRLARVSKGKRTPFGGRSRILCRPAFHGGRARGPSVSLAWKKFPPFRVSPRICPTPAASITRKFQSQAMKDGLLCACPCLLDANI